MGQKKFLYLFKSERKSVFNRLEETDAKGIPITRRGRGVAKNNLGSEISRASRKLARHGELRSRGIIDKAEVNENDPPLLGEKEVRRFHVSMNQVHSMNGIKGLSGLQKEWNGVGEGNVSLEVRALQELHGEIGQTFFGQSSVMEPHHPWMANSTQNLCFPQCPLIETWVVWKQRNLECRFIFLLAVTTPIDPTHGTFTENRQGLPVPPE
jgi:hypothetical protein